MNAIPNIKSENLSSIFGEIIIDVKRNFPNVTKTEMISLIPQIDETVLKQEKWLLKIEISKRMERSLGGI